MVKNPRIEDRGSSQMADENAWSLLSYDFYTMQLNFCYRMRFFDQGGSYFLIIQSLSEVVYLKRTR